jgi:hypothetical protein
LHLDVEPLDEAGLLGERRGEQLDRDATTESDVVGQEDLAVGSDTERGDEAIPAADNTTDLIGLR